MQQVRSALTVVCDGCFSRFRDQLEEATPRNVSKFVGVLMNVRFPSFIIITVTIIVAIFSRS
jgi:2-polyprenyl-6-methoxyphenol hydroxylase-like FAD-dependent oxidoreductase